MNNLTPLRVLLIEDSPLIRERLFESLVDPGRIEIVGEADTEEAAVALVGAATWDVLVLDLQLKVGTGLGVLRSLISHRAPEAKQGVEKTPPVEVIALGADFFFDKSREYHRVREVLEGIAEKRVSAQH